MATKNQPGTYDCYENAAPDEPMFVLLARDRHAPTLVWLWAALRELDGEDAAKVKEARDCTTSMMDWASDHGRKSVGLGQSVLVGVLELIRASNAAMKVIHGELAAGNVTNLPTGNDFMRVALAATEVAAEESSNPLS